MTDDEYKFLEVFYNRGTIQEQALVNYLNGSLPESIENKKEYIVELFAKFKEFGFIDLTTPGSGVYQITATGREKYEELSERKEINRKLEHLSGRSGRIRFDARFWVTLVIVIVVITVLTSIVLNHKGNLTELLKNFFK
jgi:hypothetical protein